MEYYWELRSKNAQNIKALMCALYFQLSSVYTVRTIFQHVITLQNSSSQDAVMASSLDAF